MAKQKTACLADIIGLLNRLCPPDLAEDWDNVGLQVGDPKAKIEKILNSEIQVEMEQKPPFDSHIHSNRLQQLC